MAAPEPCPAHGGLDPHPVAVADAQLAALNRVELSDGVGADIANRLYLPVLRVVVAAVPAPGEQRQRVFPRQLRVADRAALRFLPVRQRVVAQLFQHGGVQLELAGGRAEALRLVLPLLHRRVVVALAVHELPEAHPQRLQPLVVQLLQRAPRPVPLLPQTHPQLAPQVELRPALVQRLDRRLAALQVQRVVAPLQRVLLEAAGGGQHVVGDAAGGGHEHVHRHVQVEAHQRVVHQPGVGQGQQLVLGHGEHRPHRVRLPAEHGAVHQRPVGGAGYPRAGQRLLPHFSDVLPHDLERLPRVKLELVGADHPGPLLRRQLLDQFVLGIHAICGVRLHHDIAAGHVDVAGYRRQYVPRVQRRSGVGLLLEAVGVEYLRRLDGGVHPRRLPYALRRHAGYSCRFLRGEIPDPLGQLIEAVTPLIDEGLIVQPLGDDGLYHRQQQRAVGARPRLQPQAGLLGDGGAPGVDNDELEPHLDRLADDVPQHGPRLVRVGPYQQQALGLRPNRGHEYHPPRQQVAQHHADAAAVGAEEVGGAEQRLEAHAHLLARVLLPTAGYRQRLRPVLAAYLIELLRYLVQRLLPAHLLPPVLAALAGALQRVVQPVGVVHELSGSVGAGAAGDDFGPHLGHHRVLHPGAVEADEPAVLYLHLVAAVAGAEAAHYLLYLFSHDITSGLIGIIMPAICQQ